MSDFMMESSTCMEDIPCGYASSCRWWLVLFELSKGIYCAMIALMSEFMYNCHPHIPNLTPRSVQIYKWKPSNRCVSILILPTKRADQMHTQSWCLYDVTTYVKHHGTGKNNEENQQPSNSWMLALTFPCKVQISLKTHFLSMLWITGEPLKTQ